MHKRLRFGKFEFDTLTRELWRDGTAVRLQSQPATLLAALLASAGEVVTRESLCQSLWGSDTHVDFANGLNFCVAQLRGVLGDSADSPHFVKTVPKRGYQFIAPVTSSGERAASVAASSFRWRRLQIGVAVCVAAFGIWLVQSRIWRPKPAIRIAVARFENQSGDAQLDRFTDGLSDAVVAEFATALPGKFEITGNAAILRRQRGFQDLGRIAAELKSDFVVLGQVQRASGTTRVLIHLIRLPKQTHLWVTRVEDPDFTDSLNTQKAIAQRVIRDFLSKSSN